MCIRDSPEPGALRRAVARRRECRGRVGRRARRPGPAGRRRRGPSRRGDDGRGDGRRTAEPVPEPEQGTVEVDGQQVGRYLFVQRADGTGSIWWTNTTVLLQIDPVP